MSKRKHEIAEIEQKKQSEDEDELVYSDDEGTTVDGIYIPPPSKPVCSFDPTGPRLIITQIVNDFFKSYANEQVVGPFHKCFNAIVGPNGSGKSNVIDSMLFVFGYRAAKIRSKKVSVLLHNSETHRNVQSATVAVHFALIIDKSGDEYDIVPGSEFVVSRTAHKDNSSNYELNGRRVQFKEVALLLRKHGVDLDHNRFLILQGEVEQIAMMKCKAESEHESGMLEYLEDIIGTTRYKRPLSLLHERVENLSDVRSEKVNRLKLVENELQELKGPMEEAVGFLKAENTVVSCKNIVFQQNVINLEKELEKIKSDREVIAAEQEELIKSLNQLAEKKAEREKTLELESAKYNHLVKKKDLLKESFDGANKKDIQLQAEMTSINKNRKKTIELLAEERKKLAQFEKVPAESEQGIEECISKESKMTIKKENLEKDKTKLLNNLRAETQELQEQKEVLQTKLVVLNKDVDETKSAFTLAESELKICVSTEENEREKYESLRTTFANIDASIKEKTETVAMLKKKLPLTAKSLESAVTESNGFKEKEVQIRNEIKAKRTHLEETRSSMQASKSRNSVLNALMTQKQQGNCPGLFGRLGDLGAIDLKYDVAISTACGPLDNIVVDTVSTAQWCIEFLKKHDIGRATFIALDKQEHLRQHASSTIRTPENVPRLFDLVDVRDDRVRTAFYFALRDTLVANELEQASRIAYGAQRYRVVTLGGDLIETTGTMSGGGRTVSRGRMGQSVAVTNTNPKDLDKLEEELNRQENAVRELREKQANIEKQINVLEPELRQMKIDYEKYTIELQSLKQQHPLVKVQLSAQEAKAKSTKANPEQVKKLTAIVQYKRAEYDMAYEKSQELQIQVDALTAEIKDKTLGKMKAVDKSINEVTKTIDKCKAEITRLKVAVKTAERNKIKSADKISMMEQEIATSETRLREMKATREEIESDAAKLLQCIEEITKQIADGEEEFGEIKQAVASITKKGNKIKMEKVDVDQKLKTTDKTINDIKAGMHQWNVKLSQLKLQDIPNETVEELKKLTLEELAEKNMETIERDMKYAENQLKTMKPNFSAIQEYRKKQNTFVERAKELDEISQKRAHMKGLFDKLKGTRKQEFMEGYGIIRFKLKEMYQMITLGGDADFELVDTFDPFTEGIQFNVRPPKKSWKKISNLSGGEKTLSSLALVFALHYYKPSPLYVMDEIDAALDFKNVSIVAHYIKERTKNAQFIIISLRSNMFELCQNLIGIYKTNNCTKTIAIDPRVYDAPEERENQNLVSTQRLSQGEDIIIIPASQDVASTPSKASTSNNISDSFTESETARTSESEQIVNRIINDSFVQPEIDV